MFECKTEEEALALLKAQNPPVLETMETWDFEGWTALHWAANRGYSELSAQLLAQDPKLVAVLAKDNSTALHCAARRGHVDIVAQLLAHASRDVIFAKDRATWTALDVALSYGHEEVVGQLFDHNPEWIETVTFSGLNTGLFSAAKQGHAKVVAQVLARGPRRYDPTTRKVCTVLDGAAFGGHENIVSQLLEYDPSLLGDKSTAVHSAAERGHNKLIAHLLARNPKLLDAVGDQSNESLLHSAVTSGSVETMSQLLALKPEMIDAVDSYGRTPLQKAFLYTMDISAIVSFLLAIKPEQVYSVNNKDGDTLLHQAVSRWRFTDDREVVRSLVENVWRLNPEALHTPNREGRTPLQIGGDLDPWSSLKLFQSQCSIDQLQDATFLALDLEQFRPVIEQQCESLATTLLYPDLTHIVYQYLGLDDDEGVE